MIHGLRWAFSLANKFIHSSEPVLDPLPTCFSELFNKICVKLLMLLSRLFLLLCKGIVGVHIAVAVHTSEDGPEYDKHRKKSGSQEAFNNIHFKPVLYCLYLYCLCGEAGLRLVARSLGKARNSSAPLF